MRQAQHCTTRPRNPRGMIQSNLKDLGATWMPKMVCPYWREIRCKGDENDQDGIGKLSKLCQDGTVCGPYWMRLTIDCSVTLPLNTTMEVDF